TTPTPDANPIDSPDGEGGHGTHVAGTAAGFGVQANGTTFTGDYSALTDISDWQIGPGSAPDAGIYALKVFGDAGGSTNLVVNALEWAADPNDDGDYNDHLDILNLSLGSDSSPADDPENAFIDALTNLGVLSVIASGNAGDVTDIGGSPGNARSSLTVANSVSSTQTYDAVEVTDATDPALEGLRAAQNTVSYAGADVTAPVAYLGATVSGCTSLAASSAAITGKIVWLWWDDNDSTRACGSAARWNNATAAGAVGVLIGTTAPVFTAGILGNATIPGAQLTATSTAALLPEIQAGTLTVRVGPSLANAAFVTDPTLADSLNSSSSRGVHGSLGIVKPDVAAPGTIISSASSGSGTDRSTKSGTSMATPHVAGIAALVASAHPDWDALEIKAAVMNTATHDVYSQTGQTGPVYGPERVGSGRVDALDAAQDDVIAYATDDPSLVSVAFGVVGVGGETVVQHKTVTVQNDSNAPVTYGTSFVKATSTGGATITTNPASLTVQPGDEGLVTVTLTADPTTLAKDLDPTMDATYDLGIDVPRDYVATLSGRLVLTPASGPELRVPVDAAPRLVSDLQAADVAFADEAATSAPLTLTGRGVDQGGWTSLVAPFALVGTSPQLDDPASAGTSASTVTAGDLRYVGFASTAPQLVAAGADPAVSGHGTIGIGIATQGEWATLGTNVVPVIDTDIDGDGRADIETVIWKYSAELDFTTVETYALDYAPDGSASFGDLLDLSPVNGVWADTDTSVFDSNVVVAPINLDAVGIAPGDTPTFAVSTYSPYASDGSGTIDAVEPFTVDPFAPAYWFDGGSPDSLWFLDAPGTPFSVQRSAQTGDGQLLLLHTHNAAGTRAEVVDVTAPVATPTTTTLAVTGTLVDGAQQKLTATVAPAGVTGTVTFLDGTTTLG
ncbi:MAG: S8 family serine peptidase, partial [Cellulomonadaceae bacterium]|nr:S8 family serine peptidase [Cellulomonadaceae bacterium]